MHADIAMSVKLDEMLAYHRNTQAVKGHNITTIMGVKVLHP